VEGKKEEHHSAVWPAEDIEIKKRPSHTPGQKSQPHKSPPTITDTSDLAGAGHIARKQAVAARQRLGHFGLNKPQMNTAHDGADKADAEDDLVA
jgi:hypothetical protein